ncbi:lipid II:glycine glycyltransferase FemX [Butyrivibrio sp. XPD2002]|uniref:lipid II:glycine glycyltransferase FemX n=1 Tax=Butyrivibrio sp. XPD2002 TaxID=1280665 RepID=UPI00040D5EB2|nr:peptidoglycan bridge formation glycyltransferase FemA/FemB family protein [Butyrivibrio sp. XPD2002]
MLNVIPHSKPDRWNAIVKSYNNWDIYYLCEYAVSFQHHGDGEPLLIQYESDEESFCYVVMKRDISDDTKFEGRLESGKYFDYETPYGYGGPLCNKTLTEDSQRRFLNELKEYARENGIISQFVRFHPLLNNQESLPLVFETRYLHQTIFIETISPDQIMSDMDSKNRNMVRKAKKNGVTVERKSILEYQDFLPIYEETMVKDDAEDYYFFAEDYFKEQLNLKDNACFFYAMLDNKPIAGAIMYYNDNYMHYHLAGTHTEYRKYSPSNLLLYEAACWASEHGIKKFHLGGGMVEDDSLFGFKKQFNKNGRLPFYVGRTIFDNEEYNGLLEVRKELDPSFNTNNSRMTQYRY